jgi:hypothetical protein
MQVSEVLLEKYLKIFFYFNWPYREGTLVFLEVVGNIKGGGTKLSNRLTTPQLAMGATRLQ